jgi:ParB family chromosome partitioning protein
MAIAVQKITLSSSRDITFNKLVLNQSNVRRVGSSETHISRRGAA